MANCILDPQRDCLGLQKAEMLEKQLDEYRRQARETHGELYDKINHLEQTAAKTDVQYGQIMETLGSVKTDISELKSKPARRWEAVVDKVLLGLIGAVVVYIATRIGFG